MPDSPAPAPVFFAEDITHDQLRAAAGVLGVPWDVSAVRADGSPWWEAAGDHPMNTSHAVICDVGADVSLFYDHDCAAVVAPAAHPVWAAVRNGERS